MTARRDTRLSSLKNTVAAFGTDNRGVTAVVFAVAAVMALVAVGAAIDTSRALHAKTKLQSAADAAALLAKRREVELRRTKPVAEAQTAATAAARQLFSANIQELGAIRSGSVATKVSFPNGSDAKIEGSGEVDYVFGKMVGLASGKIQVESVATLGDSLPVEVSLVLDNTASMFATDGRSQTRFTLLRNAAKNFTHKLFDAAQSTNQNFIRVAIVPWATTVNIKGEAPLAFDFSGSAAVSNIPDRGSRSAVASPIDRTSNVSGKVKMSDFAPVGWRGCIEAGNEKIDDYSTSASGGKMWNALWVQPRPIADTAWQEGPVVPVTPACYDSCIGPPGPPPTGTQGFLDQLKRAIPQIDPAIITGRSEPTIAPVQCTKVCPAPTTAPDCTGQATKTGVSCWQWYNYGRHNTYFPKDTACFNAWGCMAKGTVTQQKQIACVSDPNEFQFLGPGWDRWCPSVPQSDWSKFDAISGPNMNCPAPMLGLSGNRRQVIAALDRMSPVPGGTHADVGLRWGLRSLAGTDGWNDFFKLATPPGTFKTGASKVMLLITDGENTRAVDYPGYWGCGSNDPADTSVENPGCEASKSAKNPAKADLDSHMLKWCESIRNTHGIRLVTIAVNITNMAAVDLLKQCAGGAKDAYSVDAADLDKLLSEIAEGSILNLRLKS